MSRIRTGCNDTCPYYENNIGCFKPEGLFCPPMSTTTVFYDDEADLYRNMYSHIIDEIDESINETSATITADNTGAFSRRCIICGESILNDDRPVCHKCREAILWLREFIGKNDEQK